MKQVKFISQALTLVLFVWMVLTLVPAVSISTTWDQIYQSFHFINFFYLIYGMCSLTLNYTRGIRVLAVWSIINTLLFLCYTILLYQIGFSPIEGCIGECHREQLRILHITISSGIALSISHSLVMSIYLMFDFQETELYYEEERVSNIDSLPLYEPKDVELPDYEMVEIISGDAPRYSQEVVPLEPLQVDAIESQEMVATEPIQDSGNAIESVVQAEPETEIEHIDLSVRQ